MFSICQWGQFDKQLGRSEAETADPEGRLLLWEEASVADIKARFAQLGFKPRQVLHSTCFFRCLIYALYKEVICMGIFCFTMVGPEKKSGMVVHSSFSYAHSF